MRRWPLFHSLPFSPKGRCCFDCKEASYAHVGRVRRKQAQPPSQTSCLEFSVWPLGSLLCDLEQIALPLCLHVLDDKMKKTIVSPSERGSEDEMHLSLFKKLNSDRQTECAQVLLTLLIVVMVTIIVIIRTHLIWSLGFSCQGTLPYLPLIMSDSSPEVFHSSLHRGSRDLPQ